MWKMRSVPQARPKAETTCLETSRSASISSICVSSSVSPKRPASRMGQRANMALASASERVRAMEDALGAPLLERQRRGVRLTPAGSALVHHARVVTQQLEEMRGELSDFAKGLRGNVRMLANTVAMTELLPVPLAAFLSAHPNIDVALEDRPSREIVTTVAGGHADIGVVTDAADLAAELETFPMGEIRLVVVGPTRHLLSRRRAVAFRDILDYDLVALPVGSALQDYLEQHAARAGRRLKLRVRLNGFDAVCRMVESGIGLAVLPWTAAQPCRRYPEPPPPGCSHPAGLRGQSKQPPP
jgi:DNA-binding transcriptional LysR family regulator